MQFQIPKQSSPKDRLPIYLKNKSDKIQINLPQSALSFLMFLAMERKSGDVKWLANIGDHLEDIKKILGKFDLMDRDGLSIDQKSEWPPWVSDEENLNRKTIAGRINKIVREKVDGNLIIVINVPGKMGIYSLIPSIKIIKL